MRSEVDKWPSVIAIPVNVRDAEKPKRDEPDFTGQSLESIADLDDFHGDPPQEESVDPQTNGSFVAQRTVRRRFLGNNTLQSYWSLRAEGTNEFTKVNLVTVKEPCLKRGRSRGPAS